MKETNSNFSIKNPMPPLWLMCPDIPNGSIGWRMGFGEDYQYEFYNWFNTLNKEEQEEYNKLFPEPKMWRAFEEKRILKNGDYWTYNLNDSNKKYSLDKLIENFKSGKKTDFLFFFGHTPPKDGSIDKSSLSQWFNSDFYFPTFKYSNMEQYMMSEKASLFNDEETLKEIMKTKNPKEIKMLGRKVKNFNEDIWNGFKYNIVVNGNYHKFMQNESLKKYLLSTKEEIIVEASPYDKVWGIGMSKDDEHAKNPLKWKGENLLGFALTEVREEIRRVCENEHLIDYEKIKKLFAI